MIEVKSHRRVDILDDGRWKLGNDAPTTRGPFQQAMEGMHSIRRYLERRHIDLHSTPMLSAVWFTHVRARTMLPQTSEWHPWQVIDSEDLRSGAAAAVLRTLRAGADHLDSKIQHFGRGGPDVPTAEKIALTLRPRFEMHTVIGDLRRIREAHLITFLEEQYQV